MTNWRRNDLTGNYVFELDASSFISFQPHPQFGARHGRPETALYLNGHYLILIGDFRSEYEAAFILHGIAGCKEVYATYAPQWRHPDSQDRD